MPRQNVNDQSVIVLAVKFEKGARVKKGDCIFEIETSKAVVEIDSPSDGIISHDISKGDEILIGSLLCNLDDDEVPGSITSSQPMILSAQANVNNDAILSKSAIKRAKELGLDTSVFKEGLISVAEVEQYVLNSKKIKTPANVKKQCGSKLVILGGGGHSKMCIDILRHRNEYQIIGILDPQKQVGETICGVKVIGDDAMLEKLKADGITFAVNGIGSTLNPLHRKEMYKKLKNIGFILPNLIHPSAVIEPSVTLGEGNQIMMGACVGSEVKIGDNCVINSGSIISHDSTLEDHSHIAPGALLAGGVIVGEAAVIGMGATIYIGVTIGAESKINNGVNVFRDIIPREIIKA